MLLMDEPFNPSRDAPSVAQALASDFARKWTSYQGNEVQHFQAHFNELCEIVGHENPHDDLNNHDFEFNQRVRTATGSQGEADVFLRDHFIMEYKKPGLDLDAAYNQNLRYRDGLGNPPILIVADFETIRIHTNFTGTVSDTYTITLDDLHDIEQNATRKSALGIVSESPLSVYQVLRYCFHEPGNLKPSHTPDQLTQAAADVFWKISDELQRHNPNKDAEVARFLSQLLFCMFASDVGLLKKQLMTEYTQEVGESPAEVFTARLNQLFDWMNEGNHIASPPIKRFNGGLFDGLKPDLEIVTSIMPLVRQADALDWSQIEPAIFGTLFERIYNPEKRAQHGRHYTSKADIETLVEPVVMTPLRRDWDNLKSSIRAADADLAKMTTQDFIDRLGKVSILDPACGSGNFLYVALNLLHGLEREVITWAIEFGIDPPEPRIHPRQLLGIEIDEYAHQLASVVVWIGHLQNGARVGNIEDRDPILDPLNNIDCRDAIIDDSGPEPRPADWPEVDFIVGNPPFLGNKRMREEMGDEIVERIYGLWGDNVPNGADLCAYWFEKARTQIADGKVKRAGLLATQAIRGGRSRIVLQNIKDSGDIFFAESDRDWLLDGAAVHTSMVGFDDGSETTRVLDGEMVDRIHSDLSSRKADLTKAQRLRENQGIAFQGVILVGPFDVSEQETQDMLLASNPDGAKNADVLKPLVTAKDITDRPSNRWVIDFGVSVTEDQAARYVGPFETLQQRVETKADSTSNSIRRTWWHFASARQHMRAALDGLERYVATPLHSKHRVFAWVDSPAIANHSVGVFAREDDYFIGVLQSRVHEIWSRALGTQVRDRESGFRYTHTTCFETFPFPEPTEDQRDAIADVAKTLMWHRKNVLTPLENTPEKMIREMTLTNVYNKNHRWLRSDHEKLDRAVFDAYGWPEDPADLDDDTILERLLELNLSREPV